MNKSKPVGTPEDSNQKLLMTSVHRSAKVSITGGKSALFVNLHKT